MFKMKNIFIVLMIFSLSACLKIQKKSELENTATQAQTAAVDVPSPSEPPAPVVFELNDVMSLTEDTVIQADKVILGPNARIYTNQFSLSVNAVTLDSALGAKIQNFPDGTLAAAIESEGLSGGVTKIKVGEAYGHLDAHMNAQQGGVGKSGWRVFDRSISDGCQPNGGRKAGKSGSFYLEADKGNQLFMKTKMTLVAGGAVGRILVWPQDTHAIGNDPSYWHKYPHSENCRVIPTVGEIGSPGQICIKLTADSTPVCEKY